MNKAYQVSDLFYTDWKQLSHRAHALVFSLQKSIEQLENGSIKYGLTLISILNPLRKNKRLVDKINEAQAVDCYNQLRDQFLTKPWYNFPQIMGWHTPDDKMARCSFDQFIYADNEFTSFLATEDLQFLKRLAVTLYMQDFDKEDVSIKLQKAKFRQHEIELIFFTYMHVREFVVKRCKNLLPLSPPQEGDTNAAKQKPSGPMWHEIKHSAARTLVFGNFDELGKANMYDVLDHLELLAKPKENAHA